LPKAAQLAVAPDVNRRFCFRESYTRRVRFTPVNRKPLCRRTMERTEILASVFASAIVVIPVGVIGWSVVAFPHDQQWYNWLLPPLILLLVLPPMTYLARLRQNRIVQIIQSTVFFAALLSGVAALILVFYLGLININSEEPGLVVIVLTPAALAAALFLAAVLLVDQRKVHGRLAGLAKWVFLLGLVPLVFLLVMMAIESTAA
jgi:hypothetical protein